MKRILVCGNFGAGKDIYDGQTVKTINIYDELVKKYGTNNVKLIDTCDIKKKPISFLYKALKETKKLKNLIVLPGDRGVKIIIPLFTILKKIRNYKMHYVVIGAWLPQMIIKEKKLKKSLKKVDYIYVENTKTLKELNKMGFYNVFKFNNFKKLEISKHGYKYNDNILKCCIFSRIEKGKGISDAINVVKEINAKRNESIFLDIYGKIDLSYEKELYSLLENEKNIKYVGVVKSNESVETIEKYQLLLFPTRRYTEGTPGTIIDAYFAGVPVLASTWENFDDVVIENATGIGYSFENLNDFKNKLNKIIDNKEQLKRMSSTCKKEAMKYTPEYCMKTLLKRIQ